jgi:adenylate cyclase
LSSESLGQPFDRLDVGIGIQIGPVVLGNIGSELKMDYTAIGDPVNVANRLQKLASPGQILVTEDVAARLGSRLDLRNLGTRELEGRDGPVTIYEVPH